MNVFGKNIIYALHVTRFFLNFAPNKLIIDMHDNMVSVIMPTYNSGRGLCASIDSILNQTYSNLELLITDDHSTDEETHVILQRYMEQDNRVDVLFLDENKGPGFARDQSIRRARGRYIAFCDSDDCWFPEKLERQIAFMKEHGCGLSYTSYIMRDENGRDIGLTVAPKRMTFAKLKHDNKIGCSTAVYDTKVLGRKYFMPFIRKRQDWGLFLTILRDSNCKACGLQEPLVYYMVRNNSVSSNKIGLIKYNIRIYEKVLGYSHAKATAYFYCLFMPTHLHKLLKKRIDSYKYLHGKRHQ